MSDSRTPSINSLLRHVLAAALRVTFIEFPKIARRLFLPRPKTLYIFLRSSGFIPTARVTQPHSCLGSASEPESAVANVNFKAASKFPLPLSGLSKSSPDRRAKGLKFTLLTFCSWNPPGKDFDLSRKNMSMLGGNLCWANFQPPPAYHCQVFHPNPDANQVPSQSRFFMSRRLYSSLATISGNEFWNVDINNSPYVGNCLKDDSHLLGLSDKCLQLIMFLCDYSLQWKEGIGWMKVTFSQQEYFIPWMQTNFVLSSSQTVTVRVAPRLEQNGYDAGRAERGHETGVGKTRQVTTWQENKDHTGAEGCIGSSYATCSRRAWEVLRHHVRQAEANPSAQLRLTVWRAGAVEIQRTKSRAKQARRNATAWMQQQ
ncbi:hypothetical protein B0H14DRAFT_2581615 [Mycena olivaceomarginata]|nr:hypothetical protein B0H14DRAFT_2581615 [Mycena olivaceomarginata]